MPSVTLGFESLGHMAMELAAMAAANASPELLAELQATREAASGTDPIHVEHATMKALIPTLQAKIAALETSMAASPSDDKQKLLELRGTVIAREEKIKQLQADLERYKQIGEPAEPAKGKAGPGRGKKADKGDPKPAGVVTERSSARKEDGSGWMYDLDPSKNEVRPQPAPVEGKSAFEVALEQRQQAQAAAVDGQAEAEPATPADQLAEAEAPAEQLADPAPASDDDDEVI